MKPNFRLSEEPFRRQDTHWFMRLLFRPRSFVSNSPASASLRHVFVFALCFGLGLGRLGAAEPFHWGVNGHPVSQEGYWQVPLDQQLDLVSELGAGWYRCDVSAGAFQASTARLDELLAGAEKRRLRLLPVLLPSETFWHDKASLEEIREGAAAFAKSIVARYRGRITHWELANELDAYAMLRQGETGRDGKLWQWEGSPEGSSAEDYHQGRYERARALIQGLHEGVKAADATAFTLVNTAGWLHHGFIERLVREDRVPFDILAWHWYSEMGDITRVQGKLDLVTLLKGYGKPLWITEINRRDGSKGGSEKEAADYLTTVARQMRDHPAIDAFFVYELLDEPYFGEAGESDYGLVRLTRRPGADWHAGARKPAFEALKSAIISNKQ
jgi:hypothetical protein